MDPKYAFFEGKIVPFQEANVSIATSSFNYGTLVFEGIRGFWNEDLEKLFVFALEAHFERFLQSCKILKIQLDYTVERLAEITTELLRLEGYEQDVYIRPLAYKSSKVIGVKLSGLEDTLAIFVVPFGSYFKDEEDVRAITSSWRRIEDNAIPARAKISGAYANSALIKDDAISFGFDEAIVLNEDGHISEASAANIFIVRDNTLITTPVTANILEGITRRVVIKLARENLRLEVIERPIDRTELYLAKEVGICGTACNISVVTSVDNRPVGEGKIGPVIRKLRERYFQIVRGKIDQKEWVSWLTSIEYTTPLEQLVLAQKSS